MICLKCGHDWNNRKEKPRRCPNCRRADWNKPRIFRVERISEPPNIIGQDKEVRLD